MGHNDNAFATRGMSIKNHKSKHAIFETFDEIWYDFL